MSITHAVPDQKQMVEVQLPSGAIYPVHVSEVDYLGERVDLYLKQNHFPNVTDLQDLDRLFIGELMVYRWGQWISRQCDYWGDAVDPNELQKAANAWSTELRQLKRALGLDKATRDRQKGDDSVSAFIQNLLIRAREFGVMRERQLDRALELFQQMKSLLTLNANCNPQEQREMHVTDDDVMEWLRTVAIPEFDEIDEYFRQHQQRTWIRSQ